MSAGSRFAVLNSQGDDEWITKKKPVAAAKNKTAKPQKPKAPSQQRPVFQDVVGLTSLKISTKDAVKPKKQPKKPAKKQLPKTQRQPRELAEGDNDDDIGSEDEFAKAIQLSKQTYQDDIKRRQTDRTDSFEEDPASNTRNQDLAAGDPCESDESSCEENISVKESQSDAPVKTNPSEEGATSSSEIPKSEYKLSTAVRLEFERLTKLTESQEQHIIKLEESLAKAKQRNKMFANVFADAELREKAEILVDLGKVKKINDDLAAQVTVLHTELEQARSRIHALESESKKQTKLNK